MLVFFSFSLNNYICIFVISGLTGVMLFVVMSIIFVFAHPIIRKKAYKFFWLTHSLYIVLYALSLIHGLARLTGAPRFWIFFIGPGIIFALDKVINTNFYTYGVKNTQILLKIFCFRLLV